jgi:hypothetical protein
MKRTHFLGIGLFTASLLTSLPAFAAALSTLPPEQTQGAVTYRSGGIGHDEAQAFAAASSQYPLTLEFAAKHTPHAAFLADVHVTIKDVRGKSILDTQSDGPFLLAKLPAGYYTVTAQQQGQPLTRNVHVTAATPTHMLFLWTAKTAV